jgi:phospholipase D1/2
MVRSNQSGRGLKSWSVRCTISFFAGKSLRWAKYPLMCLPMSAGEVIEGWFDLRNGDANQGRINLSVQYIAKADLGEESRDVDSYFPVRENCRMVLYQDADTPQLPQFEGVLHPDGSPYEATRCWRDLFHCLKAAQKFIYITGWSVFTEIQLVRGDEDADGFSNVGELLKAKAEEGVRVLLMVWNEKLSTDSSPGLMGTHDEETRAYFDGTSVECVLVSRAKTDGILADSFVGTCYTHHQKTVICDAAYEEDDSLRRVVAFIGGLDITNGRYDNPEFHLFKTINTLHKNDFYQNCVIGATAETGPRQPWHDLHASLEGPVALDLKKNFEERWCRQSEDMVSRLFQIDESEFVLDAPAAIQGQDAGSWNVQLFRSITSDSCVMDVDRHYCLHRKGGRLVENSILTSMVRQIRNAQKFIYMENQYFLGSAYSWLTDSATLSHHLVPIELTQRIIEKIEAGEPFKCYVVIPMFPEGDPASAAIQEILYWQFRTIETMYKRISKAIQDQGTGTHPTDYLSFFCLAKRESPDEVPVDELTEPEAGTVMETLRTTLRHPIYVHSKMTLIDDEYILIGSANINQRSLGGNRDTEIAVGGYQPGQTVGEVGDPRGDIHTYRMALWAAHFGCADEAYSNPASDECMAKVRETTGGFWELYTADEPQHSDVHALPYPINVDEEGNVTALETPWDCFPDTSAQVLGCKSGYLPEKLTT